MSLVVLLCYNCKSTATVAEISNLKEVVAGENFEVNSTFANPLALANVSGLENLLPPGSNIAQINLANIQNYFIVSKDSISLDLPFYGERYMNNGYGTDNGLKFDGKFEKNKMTYNAKRNDYLLEYWLNSNREKLRVAVTLYPNNSSSITVNSSHRSTITYKGNWKN
jgi:hypothetical protein